MTAMPARGGASVRRPAAVSGGEGEAELRRHVVETLGRYAGPVRSVVDARKLALVVKVLAPTIAADKVEAALGLTSGFGHCHVALEDFIEWIFADGALAPPPLPIPLRSPSIDEEHHLLEEVSRLRAQLRRMEAERSGATVGASVSNAAAPPAGAGVVAGKASPAAASAEVALGRGRVLGTLESLDAALRGSGPGVVELVEEVQSLARELLEVLRAHPYLDDSAVVGVGHPLRYWVRRCYDHLAAGRLDEAADLFKTITAGLEADAKETAAAFTHFDRDASLKLERAEFLYMCAYLGWGLEEAELMDIDHDGSVTLQEFQAFVGRVGGVQRLFELRRRRVAASRRDVCSKTGVDVGARVQAHFYVSGAKSKSWREAQVLAVQASGCPDAPDGGVLVEFGFDLAGSGGAWRAQQVVPPSWIVSSADEARVAAALREVGILEEQQTLWGAFLPRSELRAVGELVSCQRAALAHIRRQAIASHARALVGLRERFGRLGFGEDELQASLSWVQELAPVLIHVDLDRVGACLETDEFYRNQFETKTSGGRIDEGNTIRTAWERDLFGEAYDDAKAFDRIKYGVMNVTNDYRGVIPASHYGDSYLVLKDVRLRSTFASEDSGGIKGSRLAVCDRYGHVLLEYTDDELKEVVGVAIANMSSSEKPANLPQSAWPTLLRGASVDPVREWVTMGYPELAQRRGRYYFELELVADVECAQVGLSAQAFAQRLGVASSEGVGDDGQGWALDVQHLALWHSGVARAWSGASLQAQGRGVIGVAVDLCKRLVWFVVDGAWPDGPSFDAACLPPADVQLFPAVSLQGRAAFRFGPSLRFPPPADLAFDSWPGTHDGAFRLDCPRLGSSERLSDYKEAQIHGQISLKRHVQRLVVSNNYRTIPKPRRFWELLVTKGGPCDGKYERSGAHGGAPLYRSKEGGLIKWDAATSCWQMSEPGDPAAWRFKASLPLAGVGPASQSGVPTVPSEPPSRGWVAAPEHYGLSPMADFLEAAAAMGLDSEQRSAIAAALCGRGADGEEVVFRRNGSTSLESELARIGFSVLGDALWRRALATVRRRLFHEEALELAAVVETCHPYEATPHKWRRNIRIEGAAGLTILFAGHSRTYDDSARLRLYTGGLNAANAGQGARAEVMRPGGGRHFGTVVELVSDDDCVERGHSSALGSAEGVDTAPRRRWRVALDSGVEGTQTERAFAWCFEEPRKLQVSYRDGLCLGDEIVGFTLDRSQSMTPIGLAGFVAPGGPAQTAGVRFNWRLHLAATLAGPSGKLLAALGAASDDVAAAAGDLDALLERLETLRGQGEVTLVFVEGCMLRLLPEAYVYYDESHSVGDEIQVLKVNESGAICVSEVAASSGPAHKAGVRVGWRLSVQKTLQGNPGTQPKTTEEALLQDPASLLTARGVILVFELAEPHAVEQFSCSGGRWPRIDVVGDSVDFSFETDGDGASCPERCWGFAALVLPVGEGWLSRRGEVEAAAAGDWWRCTPLDDRGAPIYAGPSAAGSATGTAVEPCGDFLVRSEKLGEDGLLYLELADGRGWVCEGRAGMPAMCCRLDLRADSFFARWLKITTRTEGFRDTPSLNREGWDEARLRALCRQHGWEFEWKAEDGERQRRGAERFSVERIPARITTITRADSGRPDGFTTLGVRSAVGSEVASRAN